VALVTGDRAVGHTCRPTARPNSLYSTATGNSSNKAGNLWKSLTMANCIVCKMPQCVREPVGMTTLYRCVRCGSFALSGSAEATIEAELKQAPIRALFDESRAAQNAAPGRQTSETNYELRPSFLLGRRSIAHTTATGGYVDSVDRRSHKLGFKFPRSRIRDRSNRRGCNLGRKCRTLLVAHRVSGQKTSARAASRSPCPISPSHYHTVARGYCCA
jgi:hypothetical protein